MLYWTVLVLLLVQSGRAIEAAKPDPPETITTVGSKKLATAADCAQPIAFSGTRVNTENARLIPTVSLLNQGVGYDATSGTFTTHCPGLYQFSFVGYASSGFAGDLRLTLKKKLGGTDSWQPIATSGPMGGANIVLLRMALADQVAVFLDNHKPTDDLSTTFSGYRIAKE